MQTCTYGRTAGQVEGSFVRKGDGESGWRGRGGWDEVCLRGWNRAGREDAGPRVIPDGDDPAELLDRVAGWLREQESRYGRLAALGIASFGPVDLDPASPQWGYITSTPKIAWQYTDLAGGLQRRLRDLPVGFDTDVNGAALGEQAWGVAQGLDDFIYLTIGTGIGGGGWSVGG
jgi:fructokinase